MAFSRVTRRAAVRTLVSYDRDGSTDDDWLHAALRPRRRGLPGLDLRASRCFVINTYTRPSRAYLKLHQATCPTISHLQRGARTFTDGEYSKICGTRAELEGHARRLDGTAQPCPLC